jgi:hypothetical protein
MNISKCKFQTANFKMNRFVIVNFAFFILLFAFASATFAVPETSSVRVTDVTPSSFSVVWITDVAADPTVEVYADSLQTSKFTNLVITPMPAASPSTAQAAKQKGIMKVRVSGVQPSTHYYVRAVTKDPANQSSVGYSALMEVTTASLVVPYRLTDSALQGFANDLAPMSVYIRPVDQGQETGAGDLVVLESGNSPYPISAFVGDGALAPEGVLDLNNLFDSTGLSRDVAGGEKITVLIYRGTALSNLQHYRKTAAKNNLAEVAEPATGYFADINLDNAVDDSDFTEFKKQYRTVPNDDFYNPDFNFVEDAEGKVDVREFSAFSKEYGRTNVQ